MKRQKNDYLHATPAGRQNPDGQLQLPQPASKVPARRHALHRVLRPVAALLAGALLAGGAATAMAQQPAKRFTGEGSNASRAPLSVVTSFSVLADLVQQVGGNRVAVDTLVGPGGDTHVFQPGPTQVRQLSAAHLVVVNGLGFEGWMPRLIGSSGYKGPVVEAAHGVDALKADPHHHHHHGGKDAHDDDGDDHDHGGHDADGHDHDGHDADHHGHDADHDHDGDDAGDHDHGADYDGHDSHGAAHDGDHADHDHDHDHDHDAAMPAGAAGKSGHAHHHHHGGLDPHAWQDVSNVRLYVKNIAEGLCKAAPADCEGFQDRARAYTEHLKELDQEIRMAVDAIPAERRRVMVSHAAFGYYQRAYGITFMAPVGVSTEEEPSAAVVASLIRQAREQKVQAFFFENNSDPRLLKRMASELKNVTVGELYADSLSPLGGPASDYISMMRFNTRTLMNALRTQSK